MNLIQISFLGFKIIKWNFEKKYYNFLSNLEQKGNIMHSFTADICDKYRDEVQVLSPEFVNYGGVNSIYGQIGYL